MLFELMRLFQWLCPVAGWTRRLYKFINNGYQGKGAVGSWVVVAFPFVDRNALNGEFPSIGYTAGVH